MIRTQDPQKVCRHQNMQMKLNITIHQNCEIISGLTYVVYASGSGEQEVYLVLLEFEFTLNIFITAGWKEGVDYSPHRADSTFFL